MSPEPQVPERTTLTIETLGREQVLGPDEAARILEAVGVYANGWVTDCEDGKTIFLNALNEIVSYYLAKKLELNLDPKRRSELRKMRSHLLSYMKAARSLKHSNYPPPYLPRNWYDQAMAFYDDLEARFEERSSGGRKKAISDWEFIGQCAALFAVAFSAEPTSVAPGTRRETGAFSKFLLAIERECRKRLITPETADLLLPKHLHAEVFLANDSKDRLRDLITKALKYQKSSFDDLDVSEAAKPYWVGYKKFIQDVYVRAQKSPNDDLGK